MLEVLLMSKISQIITTLLRAMKDELKVSKNRPLNLSP